MATTTTTHLLFLFLLFCSSCAQTLMPPSYPLNTAKNSPNPNRVNCDGYFSCPARNTCCCVYQVNPAACYAWGCCPHENGTCCDRNTCCPHDRPVCNLSARTCSISKGNPLGVKAMTSIPAQPIGEKSSS